MNKKQGAVFLKYVMWYLFNLPNNLIVKQVYGDCPDKGYLESKAKKLFEDPFNWYSDLDTEHREKFCQLVLDKYDVKGELNV